MDLTLILKKKCRFKKRNQVKEHEEMDTWTPGHLEVTPTDQMRRSSNSRQEGEGGGGGGSRSEQVGI